MSRGKLDWTSNWNCHLPEWARAKDFLQWVGKCIEIVHTKFRDPRWKIEVLATLESRVLKNSLQWKKVNFAVYSGPYFFIGNRFIYLRGNLTGNRREYVRKSPSNDLKICQGLGNPWSAFLSVESQILHGQHLHDTQRTPQARWIYCWLPPSL